MNNTEPIPMPEPHKSAEISLDDFHVLPKRTQTDNWQKSSKRGRSFYGETLDDFLIQVFLMRLLTLKLAYSPLHNSKDYYSQVTNKITVLFF